MKENKNMINKIRMYIGLTQEQFSQYFHISLRTLEKWDAGITKPPVHVVYMIQKILKQEEQISYLEMQLRRENIDMTDYMKTYTIGDAMVLAENEKIAEQVARDAEMDLLDFTEKEKTELDELGLSPRAVAGIRSLGIRTIAEFRTKNAEYFDREKNPNVKNIGKKTYQEIADKLNELAC